MANTTAPAAPILGRAAVLAFEKMIANLPCNDCGAASGERCKGTCGACLSDEDMGHYPC